MGDFNLIYRDEDKSTGNFNRQLMHSFRRLINDLGIKELALHGRKFTWSNRQDTPTLVKLECFVLQSGSSFFPTVFFKVLALMDLITVLCFWASMT